MSGRVIENEDDGWAMPISIFLEEDGEIDLRLFFIDDGMGKLRPRRVAIFAIKNSIDYVSAAFIESSPPHLKLYTTNEAHRDEINKTVSCVLVDYIFRPRPKNTSISTLINWILRINLDESYKNEFDRI
jgi:hypothetical protein